MSLRNDLVALVLSAVLAPVACGGGDDAAILEGEDSRPEPGAASHGSADGGDAGVVDPAVADASPKQLAPCATAKCWSAPELGALCGTSTVTEDFSSGRYSVHHHSVLVPRDTKVELKLDATAGGFQPAIVINGSNGATLYDGEKGALGVSSSSSGRGATSAAVSLTATTDQELDVFVTGWGVVDSAFAGPMPADARYSLTVAVDCAPPPPGTLLSPPNFDPTNKNAGGYFVLPDSVPSGLYTHKAADCSRGTKRLIDTIYTVATHWKPLYPALAPLRVSDLNEGSCSTVDHATHDDGTHVDISAGCATDIACADKAPKIALAKMFVDTGVACGILNNDTAVHKEVNDYFAKKTNYAPWKSQFMRSVVGHTKHFHVRVKKPDGTCN